MGRQRNTRQPNGQDFEAVSQGYGIWTDFPSVTEETAHVFARLEDIQISHQQLLDAVCRRTFFEFEPIYYGHHYRFDFNAVAFRHDRGCFIGLNVGTYGVLNSVFQRLLSTPYYFPNIGDVSREDVSIPRSNILGLSLSNGNIQQNLGHHPKCPIRKGCVELFASIAFDFILMHELGHLSRGHLGLMGQLTGSEVYTEFTRNDGRITLSLSHRGYFRRSVRTAYVLSHMYQIKENESSKRRFCTRN